MEESEGTLFKRRDSRKQSVNICNYCDNMIKEKNRDKMKKCKCDLIVFCCNDCRRKSKHHRTCDGSVPLNYKEEAGVFPRNEEYDKVYANLFAEFENDPLFAEKEANVRPTANDIQRKILFVTRDLQGLGLTDWLKMEDNPMACLKSAQ